jgi:hypothetical protein
MKNVLMFTYAYAPSFNAGVQRPLKFAHYLPCFGYSPTIITAEFAKNVKDEEGIYRIRNDILECELNGGVKALLLRLTRRILYQSGIWWGYNYFWYKKVLNTLPKILNNESPDIIYATYPPVEPVMLGIAASRKAQIPLVVDFRDGFVFEPFAPVFFPAAMRNKKTEKYIVDNSQHIISATEPITNYFKKTYRRCSASTITNGFDRSDWLGIEISRIISENIRKTDTIFRMADDEMIVVLPQCTIPEAMGVRDRVINSWQPNPIFAHCKWQAAICDGFAEYQPGSRMRVTDLVQQAGENAFHKDKYYPQIFSTDKRSLM